MVSLFPNMESVLERNTAAIYRISGTGDFNVTTSFTAPGVATGDGGGSENYGTLLTSCLSQAKSKADCVFLPATNCTIPLASARPKVRETLLKGRIFNPATAAGLPLSPTARPVRIYHHDKLLNEWKDFVVTFFGSNRRMKFAAQNTYDHRGRLVPTISLSAVQLLHVHLHTQRHTYNYRALVNLPVRDFRRFVSKRRPKKSEGSDISISDSNSALSSSSNVSTSTGSSMDSFIDSSKKIHSNGDSGSGSGSSSSSGRKRRSSGIIGVGLLSGGSLENTASRAAGVVAIGPSHAAKNAAGMLSRMTSRPTPKSACTVLHIARAGRIPANENNVTAFCARFSSEEPPPEQTHCNDGRGERWDCALLRSFGCWVRKPYADYSLSEYLEVINRVTRSTGGTVVALSDDPDWLRSQALGLSATHKASFALFLHPRLAPADPGSALLGWYESLALAQQCNVFAGNFQSPLSKAIYKTMCIRHGSQPSRCPIFIDMDR